MQKPVGALLGHRQQLPRAVEHPHPPRPIGRPACQMLRPQAVAVARPPEPLLGQPHFRPRLQQAVHRPDTGRSGARRFEDVEGAGLLDPEPSDPRPPQRLEMRPAPQPLPDVVGEGADVEAGGSGDAEAEQ